MSQLTPSLQRDAAIPTRFVLKNVRIAYAQGLNTATSMPAKPGEKPSEPKFSSSFLIPEGATDVLQGIQAILWEVVQKEFGTNAQAVWQELSAGNKLCFRSGATKAMEEGFIGNFFISASAKQNRPPVLLHKYLNEQGTGPQELQRPQNVIYSGSYVNVQLNVWAQNSSLYGRRVNCGILVVQFAADGESFGGGAAADASMFGGVAAPTAAIGGAPVAPAAPGFAAPGFAAPGFAAPAAAPGFAAPGFAAPAAAAPGFAAPGMAAPF